MNQPHLTKEVCKCVEASRLKRSSLLQTLVSEESQGFLFYRADEKSAGKGITILCLVDNKFKQLPL